MLETEKALTRADLARQEGLTRARVTQLMTLLKLPKEIVNRLSGMTDPETIRRHSVRKLLILAQNSHDIQSDLFQDLLRRHSTESDALESAAHSNEQNP